MFNANQLKLERCPHCGIAKPSLNNVFTSDDQLWWLYICRSCRRMVMTFTPTHSGQISEIWPRPFTVSEVVPVRAREFLTQAASSLHAPAGSVMLTASAVDAMLKDKGYKDGVLNSRINAAAKDHLITKEMAEWAHEIRLDANDQRHADESAALPSNVDAQRSLDFAQALAQFLYVLPAQVAMGRERKNGDSKSK
jgi:Domain of unknown function (DUF4145)